MYRILLSISMLSFLLAGQDPTQEAPRPIPESIPQDIRNTNQFRRFWDLFVQRSNANNQIPDGVLGTAAAVMNTTVAVPAIPAGSASTSTTTAAALFTGNRWKGLGPAPILGGQIGFTIPTRPMAGRISALAIDPTNPNRWLVGGAQGGIWETLNAGANWTALTDALPSLAVGAIAIAPSNPRIIYLGSGELNNSGDSYGGLGLYRSIDGGLNWTLMSSQFAYSAFSSIWVDPTNPNILLATTGNGVFGRIAFLAPAAIRPSIGVFRSTNGGSTWTQTLNIAGTAAYEMVVNPTNKMQAIVGMSNRSGAAVATNGLYRTTDNGVTWTLLSSAPWHNSAAGVGRIELTIAASSAGGATAYASIERSSTGGLLGLWRTNNLWDATPVWTQIGTGPTDNNTGAGYCGWDFAFAAASNQCWYSHVILADATNPNILYAGGVPMWKYDGTTWTDISKTASSPANGMHVDQHAMAWAGSRLVIGNDGGVWSTTDGGATIQVHNQGLSTVQFYEGGLSSLGGQKRFIGGTQDNGTPRSLDGGATWNLFFGGDGAATSFSPTDSQNLFVSSQNLNLVRSKNGVLASVNSGLDRTSAAFIAKVEQCPFDENVVLAGNRTTQRRTDFYSGAANAGWPASTLPLALNSGVSALGFGSNCQTFAVASRGGSFLRTSDGTTWTNVLSLPGATAAIVRPVSDIAFQPGDDTTAWLTLAAFNQDTPGASGHVVKITNLTSATPTFTRINTGLNMPHNSIVVDPGNTNIIYVGTDMGVLRSADGGATWLAMGPNSGMPNVAVHDLKYSASGVLAAFTHGRGAFELTTYDITNDAAVSCADVNVIKASFNKKSGQAGFNALADLNNDSFVDIRDLRMMTRQLPSGTVCP